LSSLGSNFILGGLKRARSGGDEDGNNLEDEDEYGSDDGSDQERSYSGGSASKGLKLLSTAVGMSREMPKPVCF
jgi:hypothetical protein